MYLITSLIFDVADCWYIMDMLKFNHIKKYEFYMLYIN